MDHVWQVSPSVCTGIPGDRTRADGEVDVASCKDPSAIIDTRRGSRASPRQIGDCSVIPGIAGWIVTIGLVRRSVAAARVNVARQSSCHQAMVGKRVVCSHGPGICGDIVNLDVKVSADSSAGDAVNFAVKVSRGVKVGGDGVGWQARVISVIDRIVAPKRRRGREVLVHAAKQIDVSAVACGAEPTSRLRKRSDRRPGVCRWAIFIRVCDSDVVGDAAKTVNVTTL